MIVFEVGSVTAVKESNGGRTFMASVWIGLNVGPSSRSTMRLKKKPLRRANRSSRWGEDDRTLQGVVLSTAHRHQRTSCQSYCALSQIKPRDTQRGLKGGPHRGCGL
jgi:hypothetical protein